MVQVDEGNRTVTSDGMINFRKANFHWKILAPVLECQLHPFFSETIPELWDFLGHLRGFEDHQRSAEALSKLIESQEEGEIPLPPISKFEDAYQVSKEKMLENDEEYELQKLVSSATIILGNPQTFDRSRLWRIWLSRQEPSWKSFFLKSPALELTVQSIIDVPLTSLHEKELAESLFVAYMTLNQREARQFLAFLASLGEAQLPEELKKAVSLVVATYKQNDEYPVTDYSPPISGFARSPSPLNPVSPVDPQELRNQSLALSQFEHQYRAERRTKTLLTKTRVTRSGTTCLPAEEKNIQDLEKEGQEVGADSLSEKIEGYLQYFFDRRNTATALRNSLRKRAWTDDNQLQAEQLFSYLRNIYPRTEEACATLSKKLAAVETEYEAKNSQRQDFDKQIGELRQEEERLMRELMQVKQKIEDLEKEKMARSGEKEESLREMEDLRQKRSQKESLLSQRPDFTAAIAFLENQHLPFALRQMAKLAEFEELTRTLNTDYIAAFNLLLDYSIDSARAEASKLRRIRDKCSATDVDPDALAALLNRERNLRSKLDASLRRILRYLPQAFANALEEEETSDSMLPQGRMGIMVSMTSVPIDLADKIPPKLAEFQEIISKI